MSNVLFIGSECVPFAKSGGLGDVLGSLPKAISAIGTQAAVMIPLYKHLEESLAGKMEFLGETVVPLAWRRQYVGVYRYRLSEITYYFLDNRQYFHRETLYGSYDDGERFAFFSKAALAVLPMLDIFPDVLHCNDWQTALIPVYLKSEFNTNSMYSKLKTVFTIHNIEYQGKFGASILSDVIGIDEKYRNILDLDGCINFMKGAVVCCDQLTTVSPSYAQEITYPFYGHGLENIIKQNSEKLTGILNGIDTQLYDPSTDPVLAVNYNVDTLDKKSKNKIALQKELNLKVDVKIPMIGMVTRLVDHKGIGLVSRVLDELIDKEIQFVILGTGDARYENFFRGKADEFPGFVAAIAAFSGVLANRIYAGADLFLMPSLSEPCGLSQMIALRYGSIPVVRVTGGLADSVVAFSPDTGKGNGITFCTVNAHDMLWAINRGLEYYKDQATWKKIMVNACESDHSWVHSAQTYQKIYLALTKPITTTPGRK